MYCLEPSGSQSSIANVDSFTLGLHVVITLPPCAIDAPNLKHTTCGIDAPIETHNRRSSLELLVTASMECEYLCLAALLHKSQPKTAIDGQAKFMPSDDLADGRAGS